MSVFEADTLPAIEPLATRNHKIVKDDTLDVSIMSNITQDLKNTLQAEDLALESASEIPEVAKPTSNLNSESHVEVLPSIVNEVSDANVTNRSILTPTSNGATESVPLTEEHQHVATQPIPFEESQLEATDSLAMAESPATGQHGNLDAEENPIEAFYNTSSEISAPAGDALEADKGFILTIIQNGVDSVKVVEETPVKVDKSANLMLDVSAHVTPASEAIEHPPVVHSSQAEPVVTKDKPSLSEDTSDAMANHLVIPAAPAAPSEFVKVVEDTPTPEAKREETDDPSTTSLIVEAVEASTHADKHAEETALATSGEAVDIVGQVIFIEPLAKEENAPIIPEPATEPVTEATDGRVLDESTISPGPHVVAEVSIPAAKEIQEVPSHVARDTEPICIAPAAVPLHTVEATGPANIIQTEPEAPNATFDAPTPASDDTLIHERNVEPQEVHDMDYGGPSTAAAVPTTEKGTVEDAALPAKHSPAITTPSTEITTVDEGLMATEPHKEGLIDVSMTEMKSLDDGPAVVEPAELEPAVLPKETAENEAEEEAISGSELDSSSSNLTSAEEVSVSVSEVAGAIDAGVHEEGVSVTDVNPVAGEVLQPDEEPVPSMEIAQDVMVTTNSKSMESADPIVDEALVSVEPSEGVVPSANPHAQETSECTLVESLPIESVKVEEVKHAEAAMADVEVQEEESIIEEAVTDHEASRTNTIPEAGDEARASKQDDHPEGRPSAVIDSGLPSEEVESFEGKTTSEVMEEQKALEAPSDDQTAATEPTVEMEHSSEAPAPAGEAVVEREVRHVTDAVTLTPDPGTVEETVTAAEPIHVSEEAPAVETVPTQIVEREVRDAVASAPDSGTVVEMVTTAEPIHVSQVAPAMETVPAPKGTEDALGIDSSLSVEEDTPVQSSSEQPEPVDVQEHVHTDAKVVDELRLHENVETPQVQETMNVENPAVDVDSDIPAESLMKGELIRLEGEQIIEPSVASVNSSEEDIVDSSVNLGAVEETAMASGPTHVPQETSFVDTAPTQEDKDVAPEFNPSLSVEKGTPGPLSSELPTLNDIQGHAHTDARAVDELSEILEVHQGVDVETPVVDVDSDIPADRPVKEELITDGEELVEPLVDAPASIKSVEREVQQADLSMEAALAPEASNETKVVEGITSTPEDGATEDKSTAEEAVLSVQGTPVVHEEESRPAAGEYVPEESLTEVQLVAASEDKEVFTPPVEASKELEGTQEAAVPVGQVEIVEGAIEDSTSTVVEKDIAPAADVQQPTAEENDLEEASFAAQQTPISPVIDEEMAVSIPNVEIVPTNQEIDVDIGKNIDEPITSVLAVAPSESLVDSILVEVASSSEGDLLKTAEAEVERPKSPWTSFQVTTVGRGVSDSIEDEQSEAQESTATLNTLSDKPILDEKVDESQEVTSAIEVAHASDNTHQVHHATPQLVVDASSLDTSVEPARPWTPSYSVHLQGSPLHSPIAIEQESFIVSGESGEQGPETDIPEVVTPDPELPESKSVDEEETSMSDNLGLLEPAIAHHFDSADESAHPLPGTDIADVAVVKDVSEVEARVVGPEKEEPAETLEASAEVDAPTHTAESSDVRYELEEVSEIPKFIVGEPTEVSAQVEGDGAQLLSPLSESSSERFVSSPWVPSYSVSRQGSPLQPTAELPAEASLDVLDRDDISPVDESSIALAIPQASVEDSVKVPDPVLQTSDETVGIFPEPANLTENALPVFTVKDANHAELVDDLVESKSSDLTVVIDDGANRAQDAEPPHSSATDDGVEQPKSPWTPSYSVTVQGSEMIAGEQVHVKPLSSRDVEDEVTKDANIDRPNISDIYEPEKTVILSEESSIGLTIPQEDLSERTKQSISLHAEANLGSADPAPQESTSPVENVEQTERAVKPELPRLEPVSEAARAGTENASPPTRRRLDSTASRFIPGAWFSPASKVVNEGRTSLEIAQGEFTPLKPTSTAEDLSDSPVSDHASSTDDDNESEEEEEEKEKKGWCVVM